MSGGYYTRSKAVTGHRAAGVLPFALHEGAVLVLLGAEPCKTGPGGKVWRTMWRDFGGSREAADADSAATAAREFAEETLGLFHSCAVDEQGVAQAAASMEARLHAPGQALKVVYALKRGSYHFFITQQPFVAPFMFHLASQANSATQAVAGAEKSGFAWVPFKALLECVAARAPRYFLDTWAHVCGGLSTPPTAKCGTRRFQLHPCFANSLRMAQRCGLDKLIAAAHQLPLPQPQAQPALHLPPAVPAQPAVSTRGPQGTATSVAAGAVEPPIPATAPGRQQQEQEGQEEQEEQGEGAGHGSEGTPSGSDSDSGSGSMHPELLSLGYWVAQEEISEALRGRTPAAAELAASGLQYGAYTTAAGAGAGALSPSSSSRMRCSSVDTASSWRQSQQAAEKAATAEVVQQIAINSRLGRQRRSRKQRQKLRRQRQREERAAAEAAATAAAAGGSASVASQASGVVQPSIALADLWAAGALGAAAVGKRHPRQQQVRPDAGAPPRLPALGIGVSGRAQAWQEQPLPAHWQRAVEELEAAFQPRLRLHKRLRLEVVG